ELIVSRLQDLEPNEAIICETTAVTGREITVAQLRQLTGMMGGLELLDALDTLRRKQLMEDSNPELVRFTHAKLRNAVYQQIPQARRARLHRQMAELLRNALDHNDSASWAALAHHWEKGGVPEQARRAYLTAGRHAARRYALSDAERTLRKAIQLSYSDDQEAIVARLELVEMVLFEQGRGEESSSLLEDAIQMALVQNNVSLRARATLLLGRVLEQIGQPNEAIQSLLDAQELFQQNDDLKGQGDCLVQLGKLTASQGQLSEARGLHERAATLLTAAGDLPASDRARGELATIYTGLGRHDDALALLKELLSATRSRDDRRGEGHRLVQIARVHCNLGRTEHAQDDLQRALELFKEIDHRDGEAEAMLGLAGLQSQSGHYTKALNLCKQARALMESIGHTRQLGTVLAQMAQICTYQGDQTRAETLAREALMACRQVRDQMGEHVALTRLAEVYRHQGRLTVARQVFDELLPLQRAIGDRHGEAETLYHLGRLLRDLGLLEAALRPLNRSAALASALNERLLLAQARLIRASIHRYQGHLELASGTLGLARDLMHRSGAPLGLLGVYVEAGFLALAQGQDAEPALRQALALVGRLDMRYDSLGACKVRALARAIAQAGRKQPTLAGQNPDDLPQPLRQHLQGNRSGAPIGG
ncbi:MAG: tetratricopeptide repeat protein, partial [Myxococcota bacterium]